MYRPIGHTWYGEFISVKLLRYFSFPLFQWNVSFFSSPTFACKSRKNHYTKTYIINDFWGKKKKSKRPIQGIHSLATVIYPFVHEDNLRAKTRTRSYHHIVMTGALICWNTSVKGHASKFFQTHIASKKILKIRVRLKCIPFQYYVYVCTENTGVIINVA